MKKKKERYTIRKRSEFSLFFFRRVVAKPHSILKLLLRTRAQDRTLFVITLFLFMRSEEKKVIYHLQVIIIQPISQSLSLFVKDDMWRGGGRY